jgi:hypothetical protein
VWPTLRPELAWGCATAEGEALLLKGAAQFVGTERSSWDVGGGAAAAAAVTTGGFVSAACSAREGAGAAGVACLGPVCTSEAIEKVLMHLSAVSRAGGAVNNRCIPLLKA